MARPPPGIRAALEAGKPALVLNAAAYTAVDRAESEPEAAAALNAALPRALAEACGALDIPLVHVSTDYVFDGEKRSPYLETDAPNPLCVYGATKLAGDRAIEQAAPRRWAILRTSWVVSGIGETFPVKLLRRAKAGEPLRVVDDQWGCPTAASDLARAMQMVGTEAARRRCRGDGPVQFPRRFGDELARLRGQAAERGRRRRVWRGHRCKRSRVPSSTRRRSVPLTRSSPARAPRRHSEFPERRIEDDLDRMVRKDPLRLMGKKKRRPKAALPACQAMATCVRWYARRQGPFASRH